MSEVCHDVKIESGLQPVTGERFSGAPTGIEYSARLDIAASGF